MPELSRSAHARALARRTSAPLRLTDYRLGLRRGRCARSRCRSRYAIVRVTVDTRDPERTDRAGTLECSLCGHTWTRVTVPPLKLTSGQAPRILLTLILPPDPGDGRRTYTTTRGAQRVTGSDARIVANASYGALALALADWRGYSARTLAARHRAIDAPRPLPADPAIRDQLDRITALQTTIDSYAQ